MAGPSLAGLGPQYSQSRPSCRRFAFPLRATDAVVLALVVLGSARFAPASGSAVALGWGGCLAFVGAEGLEGTPAPARSAPELRDAMAAADDFPVAGGDAVAVRVGFAAVGLAAACDALELLAVVFLGVVFTVLERGAAAALVETGVAVPSAVLPPFRPLSLPVAD